MSLKTNYKDAIFSGVRRYREVANDDGTKSFTDATAYTQEGDRFGARDINETNTEINALETVRAVTLPASGWSGSAPYTQTVSVSGVKVSDQPVISIDGSACSDAHDKAYGYITRVETGEGVLKVTCRKKKPMADVKILVKGR